MTIELLFLSLLLAAIPGWVLPVVIVLAALIVLYFITTRTAPLIYEKGSNQVVQKPPYDVPTEVRSLHQSLIVADLHADQLLWKRSLLKRSRIGQVDLPRLLEGNVAFQVFGVVTKSPKGQNFEQNETDSFDNITLLSVLSGWPPRTWNSLAQRALYQAAKLRRYAARSGGKLMLVHNQADLQKFLTQRRDGRRIVGAFTSLEGVHALEGDLENLERFYQAGFRMIGLTHFFDNQAGGSAHGAQKGGLTEFGRAVVKRTQELNMVLDLAHASPRMIEDALELSTAPVVASHTGVCGTCDNVRNLTDDHVRGIAGTGGVIGIAMFDQAVGETSVEATARGMRYTADLVGVEHVALGGDFDGAIEAPIDSSGMALLTRALLAQGFQPDEIRMIMGLNFIRVLKAVLPEA